MSALSSMASTRVDDDDDSDFDNDEEINEVEDEEEKEVDDLSNSPNDSAEDRNDVSKEMESEWHKSHLESQEKSKQPSDTLAVGESRGNFKISCSSTEPFTRQKELSHQNDEKSRCLKSRKQLISAGENGSQESEISQKDVGAFPQVKIHEAQNELHTGSKVQFCNAEITDSETSSPSSVTRKNVTRGIWTRGRLGEGAPEEEIKQTDIRSGDDKHRMASRFSSPVIRTRSLSPGAEIKDGNKRSAVICDFFTKGWCIKGNSCRFLHVKDDMSNTIQLLEDGLGATTVKTEVQFDEERILPQELGESKCLPQFLKNHMSSFLQKESTLDNSPSSQQLAAFRDDMRSISLSKELGRESLRKNRHTDAYGNCASLTSRDSSLILMNNLLPENRSSSSGSAIWSSDYHNGNPSSYPSCLREQHWIRSKYMCNDYSSPVLSHSLNSSLGTAGPSTGSFSSCHITARTGSSFPFYSSSLNASPLDPQKLLDNDRACRNSKLSLFLRSAAVCSVSEPEKSGVSADYKAKISSNDWEPSVPFRPSFFITPTSVTSSRSQYDPLRDSFDSPKIGDVSLKVAFSSVGVSALNMSDQQLNGGSMLSKTTAPECNGDKSSVSSHGRFNESVLDKNCDRPRKDSHSGREEGVGTSIVDGQNNAVLKEDDPSVSTSVRDISKSNKINTNCDSRCQNDGFRHYKELKIDRVRQRNEMDLEHKTEGDVRKESKATKHFRTGLVDYIKELLKPTWRDGRLSKDAHNTIVKKAVDKVLSTLQPHQIPTTMESIKQYLSLSQPKIAKLVEGYVDKYGKS